MRRFWTSAHSLRSPTVRWKTGPFSFPSPADIEAEVGQLASDETLTLTELRERLASKHDAEGTCPVMCGIHLRAVAETALGALDPGVPQDEVTPVWRAIDPASLLAKKLPGGATRLRALRGSIIRRELEST